MDGSCDDVDLRTGRIGKSHQRFGHVDTFAVPVVGAEDRPQFKLESGVRAILKAQWEQYTEERFALDFVQAKEFHVLEVEASFGDEVSGCIRRSKSQTRKVARAVPRSAGQTMESDSKASIEGCEICAKTSRENGN